MQFREQSAGILKAGGETSSWGERGRSKAETESQMVFPNEEWEGQQQ